MGGGGSLGGAGRGDFPAGGAARPAPRNIEGPDARLHIYVLGEPTAVARGGGAGGDRKA